VGYGWALFGRRYDTDLITDLIMNVGAPCLVFSSLVRLEAEPSDMIEMTLGTLAALLSFAVIGAVVLRLVGLPWTSFLAPMIFANTGNMGLPVALFAFGEEGLALGVCVFATNACLQFTAGQWLWSGTVSFSQILRTPLTLAVLGAVGVLVTGVSVPEWMLRTTGLLGGFTIPLMQFTLGVTLGTLSVAGLGRSFGLSVLRIGMGLAVGVSLAELLGLEGVARGVFVLDCSMPVAVFNYLLAQRYGRSPEEVAGAVMVSTLLSLVTLPLILILVL
jgi:predicted permease